MPLLSKRHRCCPKCVGEGQVRSRRRRTKKQKRDLQHAKNNGLPPPPPPPPMLEPCIECSGTGILPSDHHFFSSFAGGRNLLPHVKNGTHVGICGGGIGGLALALACQHRNIPYTVYERDQSFNERSQGYGLTMQQGGKALQALGLETTGQDRLGGKGIHSKRHIVHRPDGTRVGEWGLRLWGRPDTKKEDAKRQNVHISRQQLRRSIHDQIEEKEKIEWGHKLESYSEDSEGVSMTFSKKNDDGKKCEVVQRASVLIGADGIRSAVRQQKIGDFLSPMRYLGCIVILGIAPSPVSSDLTNDNESVFQTADGTTRLYAMPFSKKGQESANAAGFANEEAGKGETMWQLSFPMTEEDATKLSSEGPSSLKAEALRRCGEWHVPIPELLQVTPVELVSGYPVYDKDTLGEDSLRQGSSESGNPDSRVTMLGDAAHPMSPFKGQGANQALLDAILLARAIYKVYHDNDRNSSETSDNTKTNPLLTEVLTEYESSMLKRSAAKVKASAEAAKFLHTDAAISEGNITRGAAAKQLLD